MKIDSASNLLEKKFLSLSMQLSHTQIGTLGLALHAFLYHQYPIQAFAQYSQGCFILLLARTQKFPPFQHFYQKNLCSI